MLNVALKVILAILVIGWSFGLLTTRSVADAASGLPTGKRQHKPVTLTKPTDTSSGSSAIGGRQHQPAVFRKRLDR